MRIGSVSKYGSVRDALTSCGWLIYLDAMAKKQLQAEKNYMDSSLDLTREEQMVFDYFNRGNTAMIQEKYTREQKDFLRRRYLNAYLSAVEKTRIIESLGSEAYSGDNLKPEFAFTHFEVAAMRLAESYPELFEESSVRSKKL